MKAARYRIAQEPEAALPVDEYAESTGRRTVESEPGTVPPFHAKDEAWQVANSALDAAFARGDFDNLALSGQKIDHITGNTDPDWWLKSLLNREQISGLGPAALTLRVEDEQLEHTLDQFGSEAQVREHVQDFNQRIIEARRQLSGGPPVITALREAQEEVRKWHERRRQQDPAAGVEPADPERSKRRWWGRKR